MSFRFFKLNLKMYRRPEFAQCTEKTSEWTDKIAFHPSNVFFYFLCEFSNMCMVQIFQTTFYDFSINQKLKVCQMSYIVRNLASKNEPYIFHTKAFFRKIEK